MRDWHIVMLSLQNHLHLSHEAQIYEEAIVGWEDLVDDESLVIEKDVTP